MNERIVVAQATSLQVAALAQPRIVKVTKPQGDQSVILNLSYDHGAKLDLSAIADEKLTLVQAGTKLIILFDNQSTVTAEPFFDSSGKPFADLNVELSSGRGISGEQFAQLFAITEDRSVLPETGRIIPSGADFHDVTIDPLPDALLRLALLGQEDHKRLLGGDVDNIGAPHQQVLTSSVTGSAPVIIVPSPGGPATQVFEGGLLASRGAGESAGSHAGQPSFPTTARTGTISFTSPDGVQSVSLGGHALSSSPQTFTDATGSLTASYAFDTSTHKGTINYSYTLLDNTLGIPSASFAVVVTDKDGDSNPSGNLVINIVDDSPVARADADSVTAGQLTAETGNVLDGTGTSGGLNGPGKDVPGADGLLQVAGVAAGIGPGGADPATVGVPITGQFGKLTLNTDGTYTYARNAGGGSDVFTYTIRDADGSLSHATLTLVVGDTSPNSIVVPQVGASGTLVEEAGLSARGSEPAGSNASANSETTSGTITFTSLDGVKSVELGTNVITATSANTAQTFLDGTRGQLSAWISYDATNGQGQIHYAYTLLDNVTGAPPPNQNTNTSFAVAVTDLDGDRTQGGNLVITIADDHPIARADTDAVTATETSTDGNVLDGTGTTGVPGVDVLGADGPALGGAIVGVVKGDSVGNPVAGGVGTQINGDHGFLTLDAQGHYTYTRLSAGTDVFTYTIKDSDGSLSTATLTITVANAGPSDITIPPPGAAGQGTLVDEAGLSTGTNPAANSETTSGKITFSSPDGIGSITLVDGANTFLLDSGHNPQTFIDGNGLYRLTASYTITGGAGEIDYIYTLLHNSNAGTTPSTSFTVTVADPDGQTAGGNLVIDIKDDHPVAHADTDQLTATDVSTDGNVIDGTGTTSGSVGLDVLGADGAALGGAVVQITSENKGTSATVDAINGGTLAGQFGTLTLDAQGHYTYTRAIGVPGGPNQNDVFSYTIQDSDGSQSTATLTVAVADSQPGNIVIPQANGGETTVFEAGLLQRTIGGVDESAGSNPLAPISATGTITFTSLNGVQLVELGGLQLHVGDAPKTFTDATGSSPTPGFVWTACEIASLIENRSARASSHAGDKSSRTAAIPIDNCKPAWGPVHHNTALDGESVKTGLSLRSIACAGPAAVSAVGAVASKLANTLFHNNVFASEFCIGSAPPTC